MKVSLVGVIAALSLIGAGSALGQVPPEHANASCQGRLTVDVAHVQFRDEISHEVKEFSGEPPGKFFSHFAREHEGTTVEECLEEQN